MPKEMSVNRQSKNSLFVDFFKDEKNILRMYKELHPEDKDVKLEDITIDTLNSIIVNTLYNDLGFLVKDTYVMLVEAQSTWNENIALRLLFYLAETFRRYILRTKQSELDSHRVKLPTPELYVIYSGTKKVPEIISLNDSFFGGKADIDVKVHVLNKVDSTLSGQYIGFCRVFDEQRKLHDDGMTAASETYRICIEKGYLSVYMQSHEKEVISMMYELFDEETLRKQLDIAQSERARAEGEAKNQRSVALAMLAKGRLPLEDISEYSGLSLEKVKELAAQSSSVRA